MKLNGDDIWQTLALRTLQNLLSQLIFPSLFVFVFLFLSLFSLFLSSLVNFLFCHLTLLMKTTNNSQRCETSLNWRPTTPSHNLPFKNKWPNARIIKINWFTSLLCINFNFTSFENCGTKWPKISKKNIEKF